MGRRVRVRQKALIPATTDDIITTSVTDSKANARDVKKGEVNGSGAFGSL
jgi:hypothetical protein